MLALALISHAAAYHTTGSAWPARLLPLEIHWTGSQDGLTHEELRAAIEGAAAAWTEAGPCTFGIDVVEDESADAWFRAGGVSVLFGDPEDGLADGTLGTTFSGTSSGVTFESGGSTFTEAAPVEIVFNDGAYWTSDVVIRAGTCTDRLSLQAYLTHQIGSVLGLANSCEQGDACTDADAMEATMYWAMPACDTGASTLGSDDIDGLEAIYGNAYTFAFACSARAGDGLTAECAVTDWGDGDMGTMTATWTFGDGAGADGTPVSHSYEEPGSYDVKLCVDPPDCSEPRCQIQRFVAVSDDTDAPDDTGLDTDSGAPGDGDTGGTAAPGCGCATQWTGRSWLGALLALGGWTRRRRGTRA
jgi:hypothetical protein